MKRKIMTFVMTCVLITGNCYAMQLSQPQEIGWFGISQGGKGGGGFMIKNASQNSGNYFTKYHKDNNYTYEKGLARFGNGEDSLYVHYNVNNMESPIQVGGAEKDNTVSDVDPLTDKIFRINTFEGITVYALFSEYGSDKDYLFIGRQKDGRFVKYLDTITITKKYLGLNSHGMSPVVYTNISTEGDTIVVAYAKTLTPKQAIGEFRFKWDDKAQWFGIEQVVY